MKKYMVSTSYKSDIVEAKSPRDAIKKLFGNVEILSHGHDIKVSLLESSRKSENYYTIKLLP